MDLDAANVGLALIEHPREFITDQLDELVVLYHVIELCFLDRELSHYIFLHLTFILVLVV